MVEDKDEPKPRALHKTHSIFLRYLAPSITKQEVEAVSLNFDLTVNEFLITYMAKFYFIAEFMYFFYAS